MDNGAGVPHLSDPSRSDSGDVQVPGPVGSMSPEYPKHRDKLIICVSILILVVMVAGGTLLLRGKSISLPRIFNEPVEFVRSLLKGGETYGICSDFIRAHKGLFRELGGDLEWTLVKQEIRVVNKDRKARILLKMRGERNTRFVYFLLKKYGDTWRITSVNMEVGKGRYRKIYPRKKARTRDARGTEGLRVHGLRHTAI